MFILALKWQYSRKVLWLDHQLANPCLEPCSMINYIQVAYTVLFGMIGDKRVGIIVVGVQVPMRQCWGHTYALLPSMNHITNRYYRKLEANLINRMVDE
jgi:hypothetical protein